MDKAGTPVGVPAWFFKGAEGAVEVLGALMAQ